MQKSGRNNPCPSCGRTKDADCRWSDDVIFCHQGSNHGPDQSLKVGDTILIDGAPWALVKTQGGYDGNAFVFKPHQNRDWSEPSGVNRREILDLRARRAVAAFSIERFLTRFDEVWNSPDFHDQTPDQLRETFSLITAVRMDGIGLEKSLPKLWRQHPNLKSQFENRVNAAQQGITALHEDALHFRRHYLGEDA